MIYLMYIYIFQTYTGNISIEGMNFKLRIRKKNEIFSNKGKINYQPKLMDNKNKVKIKNKVNKKRIKNF